MTQKKTAAPVPTPDNAALAAPRFAPPSRLTDATVTTMLTEALLALANTFHTPRNAERACQLLRDVSMAVAGGAEPDVAAVSRLLSELLDSATTTTTTT